MPIREKLTAEVLIRLHTQENLSLSKIGELYGVSRQRVHQLKKEYEKKHGRVTRRSFIDVITLKHYLDQGWSAKQIAERFNMKSSKVSRMIREYKKQYEMGRSIINIKRKKAEDLLQRKDLYELYVNQLLTDKEIGERYQMSASTVGMLRKEYNITTNRTKKLRRLPKILTKEKFIRLYVQEGNTLDEIADMYECNVSSILTLKQDYGVRKKKNK